MKVDPQNPLAYARPELPLSDEEQERVWLVGKLNRLRGVAYPDDAAMAARIKSYELAFRMQAGYGAGHHRLRPGD